MPPPPYYECPLCSKKCQRGHLGKHLVTHERSELVKFVINGDECTDPNWHPALDCSGHIYLLCPETGLGFERGMLIHKKHVCTVSYADYMKTEQLDLKVQKQKSKGKAKKEEQLDLKVQKPKEQSSVPPKNYIEEEEEPINAIDMVLPEDDITQHKTCNCHLEITKLHGHNKQILAELEQLKQWKISMISAASELAESADSMTKIAVKVHAFTVPALITQEQNLPAQEQEQEQNLEQKQEVKVQHSIVPVKVPPKSTIKRNSRGHIHASKKEIEKGMWCTTCAACKTVAQFSTDLRACCNCNKLSHFNDDLTNCYHWDCTECSKKSCLDCVKKAGGNKIKPFCSPSCKSIYNSKA